MATKKKMLQAAAGQAGGGAALDITDVFSTYLYDGTGSSQVIENGINLGQSNAGGSVDFSGADTVCMTVPGSSDFGFGTGDFTVEFFVYNYSYKNYTTYYDQRTSSQGASTASPFLYTDSGGTLYFHNSNSNRISGSGSNIVNGAWTHVALCRASSQTRLFVNGTQIGSTYSDSTNYLTPASNWSVGGSLEQSLYNVEGHMSNVRVVKGSALYTSNFTTPTAALTAVSGTVLLALQGDEPFTDNSSSGHSLGNNGASASKFGPFDAADAGEGGLVWIKDRSTTEQHVLTDTERGATKFVKSNSTGDEQTNAQALTSFNSNGFSIGNYADVNQNTDDFASWTFRKAPKFFDVVTWTGNGVSGRSIPHNLDAEPGFIAVKITSSADNWECYHRGVTFNSGNVLWLNSTNAVTTGASRFPTAPDSNNFYLGSDSGVNGSGNTYVAYLFAHNDSGDGEFGPDGDQDIIKCGSYVGNESSFPTIDLGFEPQWVMIKAATRNSNWQIFDSMRGIPTGGNENYLWANATEPEQSFNDYIDLNPTGFGPSSVEASTNSTGETFIYMAIRRGPLAQPEAGTEVFAIDVRNDTDAPMYKSGFVTDFSLYRDKSGNDDWRVTSRLQGTGGTFPEISTAAESAAYTDSSWDWMNGFHDAGSINTGYLSWMWKRAPGYFDVVAYTGENGMGGQTDAKPHNLGVVPEMIWIKTRSLTGREWVVWVNGFGTGQTDGTGTKEWLYLNTSASLQSSTSVSNVPWGGPHTATTFSTGSWSRVNDTGETYIAYLFASLAGVSKVGSFTATGSALDIDCGFTSGARFVLIKRTDNTGDWFVFDSVRGITASTSPYLYLNSTSSESVASYIDPLASGFTVTTDFFGSGDFLFYAIA